MCIFITAVLPPGTAIGEIQEVARRHGASLVQLGNDFVQRQLLSGETYCRATDRYCDCGTQIAAETDLAKRSASEERAAQISRLEKRGWSKTKIERWLGQHQQAQATRADRRSHASDDDPDWLSFFAEVRESGIVPYVGLLVHFYEESVSNEEVAIASREPLESASLTVERLRRMSRDRLYEIRTR